MDLLITLAMLLVGCLRRISRKVGGRSFRSGGLVWRWFAGAGSFVGHGSLCDQYRCHLLSMMHSSLSRLFPCNYPCPCLVAIPLITVTVGSSLLRDESQSPKSDNRRRVHFDLSIRPSSTHHHTFAMSATLPIPDILSPPPVVSEAGMCIQPNRHVEGSKWTK